jgi:hypothetical protein
MTGQPGHYCSFRNFVAFVLHIFASKHNNRRTLLWFVGRVVMASLLPVVVFSCCCGVQPVRKVFSIRSSLYGSSLICIFIFARKLPQIFSQSNFSKSKINFRENVNAKIFISTLVRELRKCGSPILKVCNCIFATLVGPHFHNRFLCLQYSADSNSTS